MNPTRAINQTLLSLPFDQPKARHVRQHVLHLRMNRREAPPKISASSEDGFKTISDLIHNAICFAKMVNPIAQDGLNDFCS